MQKSLILPPRLRDGDEKHRHARWIELFYDLVFAVVIYQLDLHYSQHFQFKETIHFVLVIVPVWWAWVGQTLYLTRFDTEDVFHSILLFIQTVFVAEMAVQINSALTSNPAGFILSYVGIRSVVIFEYAWAGYHNKHVRSLAYPYAVGFAAASCLWLLSIVVTPVLGVYIRVIALVLDIVTPFLFYKAQAKYKPHFSHVPERFSQFTTVLIGEAVSCAVTGTSPGGILSSQTLVGFPGLVIAFSLAWTYYEGVQAASERRMTNAKDGSRFRIWLYLHLPLTASLTALAAAYRCLMNLPPFVPVVYHIEALFCVISFGCITVFNLLFVTRQNRPTLKSICKIWVSHWVVSLVILVPLLLPYRLNPVELAFLPALVTVLKVAMILKHALNSDERIPVVL